MKSEYRFRLCRRVFFLLFSISFMLLLLPAAATAAAANPMTVHKTAQKQLVQ